MKVRYSVTRRGHEIAILKRDDKTKHELQCITFEDAATLQEVALFMAEIAEVMENTGILLHDEERQ